MIFVDFTARKKSADIDLLFPGWAKEEKVAFFSPHDDDVALGAGYLLLATVAAGGIPHLLVFCRGDAGYSSPGEKKGLVERRKKEAIKAYTGLGVARQNIQFFGMADFSLMAYLNRKGPVATSGLFEPIVRKLRREKISRVVFSSGDFEHWDHTAVFYAGLYTAPQAQDPILVDLGPPSSIKTYLAYSVWSDFEPSRRNQGHLPADRGILVSAAEEEKAMAAIRQFSSQNKIIREIVASREKRKGRDGYLELYKSYEVRRPTDYRPYFQVLARMDLPKKAGR